MGEKSRIEWTDHTFNPWEGCQKVAPECDHCYAEARDMRFTGGTRWGPKAPRRRTSAANWKKPRRWNAQAEAFQATRGRRQRVFCASLGDVFDNAVNPDWRDDLWALIRECDQLDWQLLTKRPQNMGRMLPPDWGDGWLHVRLGTSAGSRTTAGQNVPPPAGHAGGTPFCQRRADAGAGRSDPLALSRAGSSCGRIVGRSISRKHVGPGDQIRARRRAHAPRVGLGHLRWRKRRERTTHAPHMGNLAARPMPKSQHSLSVQAMGGMGTRRKCSC